MKTGTATVDHRVPCGRTKIKRRPKAIAKSQTARIAALDYHRCCLPDAPEPAQREEIRLRGRLAYREALQTSYAGRRTRQ
jgi:hypothetical protein